MVDDGKFWMDMRKIKEKKHYTKPGFFSKDDISQLRGDWEVEGLWSKGNKDRLDSAKQKAHKFVSTLPDIKTRQLAGLYSQNFVGKPSSEKKNKDSISSCSKKFKEKQEISN